MSVSVDDMISGTSGKLYVDGGLSAAGLQIESSANSGENATSSTQPSEACNANNYGAYEFIDDTNMADVWLWICEKTAGGNYGWGRIQ